MDYNLSKKQFDILVAMSDSAEPLSQRRLECITGYSLGTINKTVKDLSESGLVSNGSITDKGVEALEPHRAKRAIFLAAGFGARLVPITLNTPKPLVRVRGKRIIDGLIDACLDVGIEDIIIIRGYLGEQFDQLLYKYPMIKFIDNPYYNETNNISSAMVARQFIDNAYVLESDFLISNPGIITKYHYSSDFLGIKIERTDDWCFEVKDGYITDQKVGGIDCYQMVGISFCSSGDGKRLAGHIKDAYEMPGGRELYWEQVALKVFKKDYRVAIRECNLEDITEIDTFNELKAIDKIYDI